MRRIRALVVGAVAALAVVVFPAFPAWAAVTVSSFTPASGSVGTSVTVTGTGFTGSGATCAGMTIAFNGVHAPCVYVSTTTVKTSVPAGATTGPLTVNGVSAASPTFTVTLGITVAPAAVRPGAAVIITGSAFDPYSVLDVFFDTQDVQMIAADANGNFSGTSMTVPANATPGTHWITARETSGKGAQKSIRVATSWNQVGFGANHAGVNPFENQLSPSTVGNLNEDWAVPTGGYLDRSAPAVAGNVGPHGAVYVGQGSGPDQFMALDAQTGAQMWHSPTIGTFGPPAISGSRVYVAQSGVLDVFPTTCTSPCNPIAQSSGTGDVVGPPTASGGTVYTADGVAGVDAFPANCTGTCVPSWTGDANGAIDTGSAGGVAVSGSGWVFAEVSNTSGTPELAAYSPASCSSGSCSPVWYGNILSTQPTPIAIANGIVYATGFSNLYAFRVGGCATPPCAPLWTVQINGPYGPVISGGVVYVMAHPSSTVYELTALNAVTGATLWTSPALHGANEESVPAIADGVVYVNANDQSSYGELWAFPTSGCASTCTPLWHALVSATGYSSSPVVANGTVYDSSGDGSLYAYDLNAPAGTARPRLAQLTPTSSSRASG